MPEAVLYLTFDEFLVSVRDDTKSVEQLMQDAWNAATERAAQVAITNARRYTCATRANTCLALAGAIRNDS